MPVAHNRQIDIHWDESGSGDPLILIMGLGYTSEMWGRVAPALSDRYRTIVFDNRGVGRSSAAAGPYSIKDMADDTVAVLDAAGVEKAHVFGVSMGGMIAQEMALQHPGRVRSLILGATNCGGREATPAAAEVIGILNARATMSPDEGVRSMVPFIYDASTPRSRVEEDLAIRLRTYPKPENYLAQLRAILSWGSHSRLGEISVPTLIIHGESDALAPPANALILANAIPGASLAMLPDASHIFPTDQPDVSIQTVLSFLNGVQSDQSA